MLVFFYVSMRRPPNHTRTDTHFPNTTLCRSGLDHQLRLVGEPAVDGGLADARQCGDALDADPVVAVVDEGFERGSEDGLVSTRVSPAAGLRGDRKSTRLNSSH